MGASSRPGCSARGTRMTSPSPTAPAPAGLAWPRGRAPGPPGSPHPFLLYVRDPDCPRVEFYTCDYQTMDPDHEPIRWSMRDPRRQTLWGQPAPRSWFEEGSPLAARPP